jgi:hypothetical protein
VRLLYINQEKLRPVPILLIKFVEGGNLPAKRRSGVAAKNQYNGLTAPETGKLNCRSFVICFKGKIRRIITWLQVTSSRV